MSPKRPRPKQATEKAAAALVAINRDLSVMTGGELMEKYAVGAAADSFRLLIGESVDVVCQKHNPFWYYLLRVWYHKEVFRKRLYEPRHRYELADAYLKLAVGQLDSFDGLHNQWPRRAFKSTFMAAFADWAPKRHKLVDGMDVCVLYSHNSHIQAQARGEVIKRVNRYSRFVAAHFEEFVIPRGEWGTKEQWDWPCRGQRRETETEDDSAVAEKSMTFLSASAKKAGRGFHYKLLDDWEDEDSRDSDVVRLGLADSYDQLRQLDALPWSREASCGTPYHIQSLYRPMLNQTHADGTPRYHVVRTPALTDDNVANFPTIPKLSVESLAKERANEMARRGHDRFWYLQYQLDPTLTGDQAMQWEWFVGLTDAEYQGRFGGKPKFSICLTDPAWKGDTNQGTGADAAIGLVDIFSLGGAFDYVLRDLTVSNEMTSDQGALEKLRMMRKFGTPYFAIEHQADNPFLGVIRPQARQQTPPMFPIEIDINQWTKRSKDDRISAVAGQARTGHWYYMKSIEPKHLAVLKTQADEYPASIKRDVLDMMANAHAEAILSKWVPVAEPTAFEMDEERGYWKERRQVPMVSRYTGLPAVMVH